MPAFESAAERGLRLGRIQQRFGDVALILDRQAKDLGFLDGAGRRFAGGTHYKVRQGAPLDIGRAFEQRVNIRGQTRFQAAVAETFSMNPNIRQFAVRSICR